MLEQKPNSEQKDETLDSSSPNSINTNVVGSQCHGTLKESVHSEKYITIKINDSTLKVNRIGDSVIISFTGFDGFDKPISIPDSWFIDMLHNEIISARSNPIPVYGK